MFIDCSECGAHVLTNVSDYSMKRMCDMNEPVYCDGCSE